MKKMIQIAALAVVVVLPTLTTNVCLSARENAWVKVPAVVGANNGAVLGFAAAGLNFALQASNWADTRNNVIRDLQSRGCSYEDALAIVEQRRPSFEWFMPVAGAIAGALILGIAGACTKLEVSNMVLAKYMS
jgi:hypothetical protein